MSVFTPLNKLRLKRKAIRQACDELGLQWPVIITYNDMSRYTRGMHYVMKQSGKMFHRIELNPLYRGDMQNRTLWHELGHACRSEYELANCPAHFAVREYDKKGIREKRRFSYRNSPHEMMAHTYESKALWQSLIRWEKW